MWPGACLFQRRNRERNTGKQGEDRKMKKLMMVLALTTAVAAGAFAAEGNLKANIPFDFKAGNTALPAGAYAIQVTSMPNTLLIVNRQTGERLFLRTIPTKVGSYETPRLVFNKYSDGRVFLSQIRATAWSSGMELPKTKLERELMSNSSPASLVAIAYK